jgi:tRNA-2-methylthio-N6-dimethylallyladenosine synthase
MKKVYLETFGCQMNVSDSERVATKLASEGYAITNDAASADVVLINTCSVREKAEQKLFSKIGRIRKQYGDQPVIGVMGGESVVGTGPRVTPRDVISMAPGPAATVAPELGTPELWITSGGSCAASL